MKKLCTLFVSVFCFLVYGTANTVFDATGAAKTEDPGTIKYHNNW